jgi:formate-nitrite transporter family protein
MSETARREAGRQGGEVETAGTEQGDGAAPALDAAERRQAHEAASLDAKTTYEVIREQGDKELERPPRALAWSGLSAGLSMGLSMAAEGVLRAHLPDAPWRPLVAKLGYSVGFLAVILGSQQLFTENTLTPVVPYLSRKSDVPLRKVLRLWGIVFVTNILGTLLFAIAAVHTELFRPEAREAFSALGTEALGGGIGATFVRAIGAGWLIALMVWMLPDAKYARLPVIVVMTWLIGAAGFSHIIAGSAEVLYTTVSGAVPWSAYFTDFMLPTLAGNVLGGTGLVAALNHAQVVAGKE